jgi:hypothetical protein CLOST_1549
MKNTINGFRQDKLIENGLDLADSLILRLFADMYSSNSSKIEYQILEYEVENEETKEKTLEKDKFMWITYDYLYSQIPLVGSKSTFIRKVGELVEKGFLKKQVRNSKKGKKGTFLYISFGEKFSELTEYETEDTPTQNDNEGYSKQVGGLPKLNRGATQNDKGGYSKWVDKDSTITDTSLTDSSIRDRESKKEEKNNFSSVCEEIKNKWIEIANNLNLSGVKLKINDKRKKAIKILLNEYTAEEILQAMEKIHISKFLQGDNKNNWQITFDWFINKANLLKVLEGNYDDKVNTDSSPKNTKEYYQKSNNQFTGVTDESIEDLIGGFTQ